VVGAVVVVPVLGTQLMLVLFVACAGGAPIVPTWEGAGVAATGCCALGVGALAVVVLRAEPAAVLDVPDCAIVPVGHGDVPAPSPLPPLVTVLEAPVVIDVPAPGEVPGIAVVFMPGVCPGVVPDAVPGVTLGVVP
jgi:hypothetical protein